MQDRAGTREVFTDGACRDNGARNARGGVGVFFGAGHEANVSRGYMGTLACCGWPHIRVTNQTMELLACVTALRTVLGWGPTAPPWTVVCDSEFVINCVTAWRRGWERNGYRTRYGKPVKNAELVQELVRLQGQTGARFEHVRAHQPRPDSTSDCALRRHDGNAAADRLARAAATAAAAAAATDETEPPKPPSRRPLQVVGGGKPRTLDAWLIREA